MIAADEQIGTYLGLFSELQKRAPGHDVRWLRDLREGAFARFCDVGFPTTHDEDWRFTNVSAISCSTFELASDESISEAQVAPFRIANSACQLVFVNGHFSPRLSKVSNAAAGVAKTLKCGECGTLNRPTEWYCERCGAELAGV